MASIFYPNHAFFQVHTSKLKFQSCLLSLVSIHISYSLCLCHVLLFIMINLIIFTFIFVCWQILSGRESFSVLIF